MINRRDFIRTTLQGLLAATTAGSIGSNAYAAGEKIILVSIDNRTPTTRSVGRGTWNTYRFQLVDAGRRPIRGKLMRFWFTDGGRGVGPGYQLTTDNNGVVTHTVRSTDFRASSTLFLNAESKSVGVPPIAWRVGY